LKEQSEEPKEDKKSSKKLKTEAQSKQAEGKLSEIFIPHLIVRTVGGRSSSLFFVDRI